MNLILITSIINICNKPLSYSNTRSFCNIIQREEDTIKSIDSVRRYIPNSKILLVECSELTESQEQRLISKVDNYLNFFHDKEILKKIDSPNKALGESTLTIKAIEYILNNKIEYTNFFKLSGRYWLNNNFKYLDFNNDKIVVSYINNINIIYTVFYKLPIDSENIFLKYKKYL